MSNSFFCAQVVGLLDYDHKTKVDITSDNEAYYRSFFQLPQSCFTTPQDFCSTAYFPGNPCDTVVTPPANCPLSGPTSKRSFMVN